MSAVAHLAEITRAELTRIEFWSAFAPDLHIGTASGWPQFRPLAFDPAALQSGMAELCRNGYVQFAPRPWGLRLADLAAVISKLDAAGLPPVLAFVYDEFWLAIALPDQLLSAVLGVGYKMLPEIWAWRVDPRQNGSGWPPHRDKGCVAMFADGRPKTLNIWLPLTDATPASSCIYVVPAALDPAYNNERADLPPFNLSDIAALPAAAGSINAWTPALLHWGSRAADPAAAPRISIACEFQRGDLPDFSTPTLTPRTLPSFTFRRMLIASLLERYAHMHSADPALLGLAHEIRGEA